MSDRSARTRPSEPRPSDEGRGGAAPSGAVPPRFTPGPWLINRKHCCIQSVATGVARFVAPLAAENGMDPCLVVAAPDMHAALTATRSYVASCDGDPAMPERLKQIDAALNKAAGVETDPLRYGALRVLNGRLHRFVGREAEGDQWEMVDDPMYDALQAQMEAQQYMERAAPDLLAALKRVVAVADRKTDEFDAAHAAIAKAEGRP